MIQELPPPEKLLINFRELRFLTHHLFLPFAPGVLLIITLSPTHLGLHHEKQTGSGLKRGQVLQSSIAPVKLLSWPDHYA